jgi:hypothetical protein
MSKEEIHKWLVKYSLSLNRLRKEIESQEELDRFDAFVRTFLDSCPNWWSKGSDTDKQATASPDLFFQAVIAKTYPSQSYKDAEDLSRMRNLDY